MYGLQDKSTDDEKYFYSRLTEIAQYCVFRNIRTARLMKSICFHAYKGAKTYKSQQTIMKIYQSSFP